ncbi:GNAT family N-acetyltransferase [Streptomyces pluripotens]|uniref:GNAT family N-acetyltransferase n=1 Tax=Streptomyces pluripotens TaxID=1355015 RepID=A0A221NXK4_9ACTN|nr:MULTISPECIES: GNAT family N-acetyltransferase [Streptomyces]ARP70300.1 glycosyl transferase family 1 [Streptomyces pluripotens]ASN24556.1 GNAT family N-acetyltransferase [Streptomyces pluripotens]KIE28075.1 glycosyl transferase family 1 [Streptomyces sp. MUSC 125]
MTATYPARSTRSTRSTRAAGLVSEVVTDEDSFARLAPAWGRLHERCTTATPFQSHAWLHSWWWSYGTYGRLRVIAVRSGGQLVAAAPLMLIRRPLPTLVPLGGAISDYADVLLDDADDGRAAGALTDALADAARTALIDFREVRPGGAVEQVYDRWRGPRHAVHDSLCLELPAVPMDELVARLPSNKAQQRVRAKLRKLDVLGVQRRTVRPEEVDAALGRLLELHRLQWRGRKVTSEHLQPRFRDHLVRAVGPMVRSGNAVVTEFRIDGEVVAVDLTLLSRSLTGGYLYGAHPGLRERKADVAVMLLEACAEHTGAGGPGTLSLLRGNEPYKHHWRPEPVVNQRLLLARRRTAPLLTAVLCDTAARQRSKEVLQRWRERGRD